MISLLCSFLVLFTTVLDQASAASIPSSSIRDFRPRFWHVAVLFVLVFVAVAVVGGYLFYTRFFAQKNILSDQEDPENEKLDGGGWETLPQGLQIFIIIVLVVIGLWMLFLLVKGLQMIFCWSPVQQVENSTPITPSSDVSKWQVTQVTGQEDCKEDCAVCMAPCQGDLVKLGCGHLFHQECIGTWLTSNATCPNCRAEVKPVESEMN